MREITLKIYLDKMYIFKTKSEKEILKDYLIDIFGTNIKIFDNRFYLPFSNSNKSTWLVFDKKMRIISLNDHLQNTIILCCLNLNFIKKYLDLPYWKKIIESDMNIMNNRENLASEVKDGQNEIMNNIEFAREIIHGQEEKSNHTDVKSEVKGTHCDIVKNKKTCKSKDIKQEEQDKIIKDKKSGSGVKKKNEVFDHNVIEKIKKIIFPSKIAKREPEIVDGEKVNKVDSQLHHIQKYTSKNEKKANKDKKNDESMNSHDEIIELIREKEENDNINENVEYRLTDKKNEENMQKKKESFDEMVGSDHKEEASKHCRTRQETKKESKRDSPQAIHFFVKMSKDKQQIAVVEENKNVNKKGQGINNNLVDSEYSNTKKDKIEVATSGSDSLVDMSSGNNFANSTKKDDAILSHNKDLYGKEEQKIFYTVISPTGEVIYNKIFVNEKPISVEELLLKSGLTVIDSNGFVESIEGFKNEGMSGWVFEVNNAPIMVPASEYIVNPCDKITWKYVDFSKMIENETDNENTFDQTKENVKVKSIFNE